MGKLKEVNVHIGEVKIATNDTQLKAIFGSCVGVALFWKKRSLCTLTHCLLPSSPEPTEEITGRWVDVAIASSLRLMDATRANHRQIEAVVTGGGNIVQTQSEGKTLVGASNVAVALETLKSLRIAVIEEDVGGDYGRRIIVNGASLEYRIERIPRSSNV